MAVAKAKVPDATVSRLVTYLRVLEALERAGVTRTSSEQLAEEAQVTAFQGRKDLAYFGNYGTRGVGYSVPLLKREIRRILGLSRRWRVVLVGMGRLGQALADYPGLGEEYELVGLLDIDPAKVGKRLARGVVEPLSALEEVVSLRGAELGLIAVPADAAQEVADRLVRAGIRGILNFAPVVLEVPPEVAVENVDLVAGLNRLTYFVTQGMREEWVG